MAETVIPGIRTNGPRIATAVRSTCWPSATSPIRLFAAFDQPDRVNSCPARATTITAPQALAMLNGEFTLAQARYLAALLAAAHGRDGRRHDPRRLSACFSRDRIAANSPRPRSSWNARHALIASNARRCGQRCIRSRARAAVVDFCHALLNSAEFLDVE